MPPRFGNPQPFSSPALDSRVSAATPQQSKMDAASLRQAKVIRIRQSEQDSYCVPCPMSDRSVPGGNVVTNAHNQKLTLSRNLSKSSILPT